MPGGLEGDVGNFCLRGATKRTPALKPCFPAAPLLEQGTGVGPAWLLQPRPEQQFCWLPRLAPRHVALAVSRCPPRPAPCAGDSFESLLPGNWAMGPLNGPFSAEL